MKEFALTVCIGLIVLAGSAGLATAAPLTWTIHEASLTSTFVAMGTMSGSFDYDADTNVYSNLNITVNGFYDLAYPEDIYVWNGSYTTALPGTALQLNSQKPSPNPAEPVYLNLDFASALTGAGGTVSINTGTVLTNALYNNNPPYTATLGAGATVSAVPAPAAVWLFGSALAGLAWLRRR